MATIVNMLPDRSVRYPWNLWTDGNIWELTEGEDFTVSSRSFTNAARSMAKRLDVPLRCSQRGNKVYLRFGKPDINNHNHTSNNQ